MRMPTTAQLLDAWDALRDRPMPDRAAALVALVDPALAGEEVATMPLGRRDRCLLELRAALFGSRVQGISTCPGCGEAVEAPFSVEPLLEIEAGAPHRTAWCEDASWRVRYRAPTTSDASALAVSATAGARALALRCIVEAHEDGRAASTERIASSLPDAIVATIASGIAVLDPAADVLLDVTCPACGDHWQPPFDAASFLWAELSSWARRTLCDVACLARAYGWREPDILAMSPQRRADYLELLTA